MSISELQPQLLALLRMLVEQILAEVFPDETGAARIQQVGVFTLILMLQNDTEPVTAARLAAMSGQDQAQVHRQLKKLLKVGIVERTAITSPHGRGRAWHLSVRHTPETARLAKAILGGAKASAKPRKA
jgi:predicted ArsR family transcriptional regulator